jgi:hypothetical protein
MKLYSQLFKELDRRAKLPHLERDYTNGERLDMNPDVEIILRTGRIRDEARARKLMEEMGVKTGYEAVELLPPRPPVNWRKRVQNWLARLEGAYTSNPHAGEFAELRKEKR